MVVFTCNYCGESLQKPRVEKHYSFVCRTEKFITCVDCFKDFRGEEYVAHTKCITEEERYAAKGSLPNGVIKKGEVKQESWVDMIKSIIDTEPNLPPPHKNLLNTISSYNNIPRKKQKFINFIKSSSGGRANLKDVEAIWNIIEKYKNQQKPTTQNTTPNPKQEKNEENMKKRKNTDAKPKEQSKKLKADKVQEDIDKFSFQGKILEILTGKESISTKKLQKKVLNAYIKWSGQSECSEKTIKKYEKKLKKVPNINITDNIACIKNEP
ncbi:unnamed protein product [Brassicogethes aeneus]|uniref:Cell growth-regulating nucleolar protein n=1 Tax=Brassicogethes aeneus TaxID=1431903 RepID=A0A9P0ASK4_BRAAE|nr:unnamed protein product [Brassicogethes aeneus]